MAHKPAPTPAENLISDLAQDDSATNTTIDIYDTVKSHGTWWDSGHRRKIDLSLRSDSTEGAAVVLAEASRLVVLRLRDRENGAVGGNIVTNARSAVRLVAIICSPRPEYGGVAAPQFDGGVEVDRLAQELLAALCTCTCASLKLRDGDARNAGQRLARYVLSALLATIDPLIPQRAALLAPTWRGLCDVAATLYHLSPPLASGDTTVVEAHFLTDSSILKSATSSLLVYLREGETQVRAAVGSYLDCLSKCDSHEEKKSLHMVHHSTKIVIFLVARLGTLVPLALAQLGRRGVESSPTQNLPEIMVVMARLRGLSVYTRMLVDDQKESNNVNTSTLNAAPLLKVLNQLSNKVDHFITKVIFASTTPGKANMFIIQALLDMDITEPSMRSVGKKDLNDEHKFFLPTLRLGKFLLLQSLLGGTTLASKVTVRLGRLSSDSMLSVCEAILFEALPICYPYFFSKTFLQKAVDPFNRTRTTATSLVAAAVEVITNCISWCERQADGGRNIGMVHTHRILVRWLAPIRGNDRHLHSYIYEKENLLHPLTREVLLSVVHLHTLRLCFQSKGETKHSILSQTCLRHLIGLMCQVVVDLRTIFEGRSNVAAVLVRILRGSHESSCGTNEFVQSAKVSIIRMVAAEIGLRGARQHPGAALGQGNETTGKRKQRRQGCVTHRRSLLSTSKMLSAWEIDSITSIVEAVATSDLFWAEMDRSVSDEIKAMCREALQLSPTGAAPTFMNKDERQTQASILISLSLVMGCIAGFCDSSGSRESSVEQRLENCTGLDLTKLSKWLVSVLQQLSSSIETKPNCLYLLCKVLRPLRIIVAFGLTRVLLLSDIQSLMDCLLLSVRKIAGGNKLKGISMRDGWLFIFEVMAFLGIAQSLLSSAKCTKKALVVS